MSVELCGVANGGPNWMAGRKHCSLQKGHEGQHLAFWYNEVTLDGRDVTWLGPWEDGRDYDTALTEALQEAWERRYDSGTTRLDAKGVEWTADQLGGWFRYGNDYALTYRNPAQDGPWPAQEHEHIWYFDHTYEDWWAGDSDDIYYCCVSGCSKIRRDYVGR